jgi:hypothetical protein
MIISHWLCVILKTKKTIMDITLITKIVAAGAMGVSIYCIIKVYDLLKNEQKEKIPRQNFIRTIYVSMGFAVLMTLLSLGIEIIREEMGAELNTLEKDLTEIESEKYYSFNSNGNPKEINLSYKNKPYILSKAFPKNHFKTNELKFKKVKNDKYLVIKKNLEKEIIFGFINKTEIKLKTKDLFSDTIIKPLSDDELWGLGIFYTPVETTKGIGLTVMKDRFLAIEYLIKFLDLKDVDNASKKEEAIKLLVQPQLMNRLSQDQYKVLIKMLESDIRETPWDKYELAQVHLSRSGQSWNKAGKSSDKVKAKERLKDYVTYYNDHKWIQNSKNYPKAFQWYEESKSKLEIQ